MTIDTIVLSNGDSADVGDRIRDKGTNPDDPPIIFGWATMQNLLDLMNDPVAQANAPPQPFTAPLVGMVTEDALRLALINLFRVPGSAQPIGCTCLPCTGAEYGTTSGRIMLLCYHPWIHFQEAAAANAGLVIFPLAELYIPRPRSIMLDRFNALPIQGGAPLWI
jgi:hypothetical protein